MEPKYNCPECGNKLEKVTQSSHSILNEYQFEAVKAGDYFCKTCKGNRGKTGYRYYWKSELENMNSN